MKLTAFRVVADHFDQPCILISFSLRLLDANKAAIHTFGIEQADIGASMSGLIASDQDQFHEFLRSCSTSTLPKPANVRCNTVNDERVFHCFGSRHAITVDGEPAMFLRFTRKWGTHVKLVQLTRQVHEHQKQLRQQHEQQAKTAAQLYHLERKAYVDQLTGVLNRNAYIDTFNQLETKWNQRKDDFLAYVLIDINGMKNVNDTYGHEKGDELLRAFCISLKNQLRDEDRIYRLGGDEFACILKNGEILASLEQRMKKVADEASQRAGLDVRFSTGIATSPEVERLSDLYTLADQRMYKDKQQSRSANQ